MSSSHNLDEYREEKSCTYNVRENSTHGHHRMVYTKVRLIVFLATEDGEALYSQLKQDWELTVAQIMSQIQT